MANRMLIHRKLHSYVLTSVLTIACAAGCGGSQPPATGQNKPATDKVVAPATDKVVVAPATDKVVASATGGTATPQVDTPPVRQPSKLCDAVAAQPASRALLRDNPPAPGDLDAELRDLVIAELIAAHDRTFRRSDHASFVALDRSQPAGLVEAHDLAMASVIAGFRGHLALAADLELGLDKRRQAWDDAACLWEVALAGIAAEIPQEGVDAQLGAEVTAAFQSGRAGFAKKDADTRDQVVLPARQAIEKRLYRALHRRLLQAVARAEKAPPTDREQALKKALRTLGYLADRIETKNTPGLQRLQTALAQTTAPTVEEVRRELNIAFAKRARKYCSDAVDHPKRPLALRLASAAEGATYVEVVMPDMARKLADEGFDAAAHREAWDNLQQELAADPESDLSAISQELVRWNCAYQLKLGIRECTSSKDEQAS